MKRFSDCWTVISDEIPLKFTTTIKMESNKTKLWVSDTFEKIWQYFKEAKDDQEMIGSFKNTWFEWNCFRKETNVNEFVFRNKEWKWSWSSLSDEIFMWAHTHTHSLTHKHTQTHTHIHKHTHTHLMSESLSVKKMKRESETRWDTFLCYGARKKCLMAKTKTWRASFWSNYFFVLESNFGHLSSLP